VAKKNFYKKRNDGTNGNGTKRAKPTKADNNKKKTHSTSYRQRERDKEPASDWQRERVRERQI